ncbi:hypothetical protein [Methanococcus maripaludis]|uniref:Uncharacterized protein n=1 Tax=Methanococcus maripaludis TaxID=39152 RepID=A0A8T4H2X1_METMI|nr:hypothetical protein [Methanococcus maripaludis]MBM7408769.1 hypothetical protein [Methanococcus maripaludis]MBP2219062.1 hypothetical protein [Methanococcus maripaludis]
MDELIEHIYYTEKVPMGTLNKKRYFETEEQKQQYLTLIEQGTAEEEAYTTVRPPIE